MTHDSVAVIGAGLAGLAAANRLRSLGVPVTLFEKSTRPGGHARSIERDGFTFDEGPHVSFTKDRAVQSLFADGAGDVRTFPLQLVNAYDDRFIRHPVQCHLAGLSRELISSCIADLVDARAARRRSARTYEEWCLRAFGRTFSETFAFPYTRKYWTVPPARLTTDWIGERVHAPNVVDVVMGALGEHDGDFHYLSTVRYPATGGFQAFLRRLERTDAPIVTREAIRIDPRQRLIAFQDGGSTRYEQIISTIPLPVLVGIVDRAYVPDAVRRATRRLFCTSLALVDVGARHVEPRGHIVYVYDERFACARIHLPHLLSPANAPEGRGSVQAEVYYSRYKPPPTAWTDLAPRVVEELVALKILRNRTDVIFASVRHVPFANVTFTTGRAAAVMTIRRWLERWNIQVAGRYGEWDYYWTDDAVRSGWRAADAVAHRMGVKSGAIHELQ